MLFKVLYFNMATLVMIYRTGDTLSPSLSLSPVGPISIWQDEDVNLTCDSTSTNKIKFKINTRNILIDNKTFTVTVLKSDVSVLTIHGTYMTTCEKQSFGCISNIDSTIYESNKVDVTVKPLIKNVTISRNGGVESGIKENRTVDFTCSTSCTCTRPSVKWNVRDNDSIINNQTECQPITNLTTSRLTYKVNRLDNGSYIKCAASNENGHTVYSSNITLIVYYPPHVNSLNNVSIWEGESLDISCVVSEGNPSYTYIQWTRSLDRKMWTTQRLNITSVKRTDSSTYTCTAWNVMHPTNRSTENGTHNRIFTLNVKYETTIRLFSVNISDGRYNYTLPENTTFVLVCEADGNPLPNMSIIYMDDTLKYKTLSDKVSARTSVSCTDLGVYTCQASNRDGQISTKSININVLCTPRRNPKVTIESIVVSALKENVTLSYTALAYPHPTFTWYRHGSLIDVNDPRTIISSSNLQTSLTIPHVEENDFGPFMLHIANEVGSIIELFDLQSQEKIPCQTNSNSSQGVAGVVVGTISGVVVLCGILLFMFIYLRRKVNTSRSTSSEQTPSTLPVPYENLKIEPISNVPPENQNETPNDQYSETNVDHTYEGLSPQDNGSKSTYDDLHIQL